MQVCSILFCIRVADLSFEAHADLHQFNSAPEISCLLICKTQIPGCIRLAPPVPDLAGNGQMLLVVLDGLPGVAQGGVGQSQLIAFKRIKWKGRIQLDKRKNNV